MGAKLLINSEYNPCLKVPGKEERQREAAGKKSGVGPGDATSLGERQTHQRHIVVGLPIGLPEMGNNDIDDIYNKPLREVYKESTAKAGGGEEHVGVFQNYPGSAPSASQRPGSEDVVLFDLDGGQDDSTTTPQMSPLSPPPITASIEEEEEVEPRIPELEEYEELRPSRPHAQPGHATARSKQDLVRVPASSRTAAAKSGLRVDNSGFVLRPHPTSGRVERKPPLAPL